MNNIIEILQNIFSAFDLIVLLIVIYSIAECVGKGFLRSLLSFSKWILALIITIILVPKLNPIVQEYIESDFIADIGLGIFIYIVSLFIIINIGKAISSAITYTGLGAADKSFGLFFGIFKGYVICICLFSLLNWFYPHNNWPIKTEGTYSFQIIYKGSEFLVNEFPNSKNYYEQTEEKLEKI
tara:strand:- start:88 stop:636 length:549 start_codon:yes stop_codon:yes gene_type:complete